MLKNLMERVMGMTAIDQAYEVARQDLETDTIFQAEARVLDISIDVSSADLRHIPQRGPLIIVANHPLGFPEGLALPALIDGYRNDLKILSHSWFSRWPEMAERMIFVDPQAEGARRRANRRAIVEALRWLQEGNSLLVFPAGEVARYQRDEGCVAEVPWKKGLVHLAKMSEATVLPMHVGGRAGWGYQLLSLIHRRLGVFALGRELLAWRGRRLAVQIGPGLDYESKIHGKSDTEILSYLRGVVVDLATVRNGKRTPQIAIRTITDSV